MNHRLAMLVATLFIIAMPASSAVAHECPGESTWTNELGSTLHIEDIDSEGRITGIYVNRAQGYNCQGTPYPVTGWVLDGTNTITFTVKWENTSENCKSITTWAGFFSPDCTKLTTLWYLVVDGTTSTDQILTGTNIFTPNPQTTSEFVQQQEE